MYVMNRARVLNPFDTNLVVFHRLLMYIDVCVEKYKF